MNSKQAIIVTITFAITIENTRNGCLASRKCRFQPCYYCQSFIVKSLICFGIKYVVPWFFFSNMTYVRRFHCRKQENYLLNYCFKLILTILLFLQNSDFFFLCYSNKYGIFYIKALCSHDQLLYNKVFLHSFIKFIQQQ